MVLAIIQLIRRDLEKKINEYCDFWLGACNYSFSSRELSYKCYNSGKLNSNRRGSLIAAAARVPGKAYEVRRCRGKDNGIHSPLAQGRPTRKV